MYESPRRPSTSGRTPSGSRQASMPSDVRQIRRIGAFDPLQRIDEAIEQGAIARCGDEVDDDFGVAGRLKDRTAPHQVTPQRHRVGNIAIMADGKTARRQFGEQRLDVAQRGFAGGRIAVMADGDVALELLDDFVAVEIAGNMPHGAMGVEILAVEGGDAGGFLAAMLKGMQAERDQRRRAIGAVDAKYAAFFVEMIIFPRIGCQHVVMAENCLVSAASGRHIG